MRSNYCFPTAPDVSLELSPAELSAEFRAGETLVVSRASRPPQQAGFGDLPEALLEVLATDAPSTTAEHGCDQYGSEAEHVALALALARAYDEAVADVTAAWSELVVHESAPALASPTYVRSPDVDERQIRRRHHRAAVADIPRYRIRERREARERCAPAVEEAIQSARQDASQRYELERLNAEREWESLLAGDVEQVSAALLRAKFPMPKVIVDVSGTHVSILCWVRGVHTMPHWVVEASDDGGRLVRADDRHRVAQHREHVLSAAIASTRAALAAAPSIVTVHTAVMETGSKDVFGRPRFGVMAATSFERDVADRVLFHNVPSEIVREAAVSVGTMESGHFRWLTPDDSTDLGRLVQRIHAVPRGGRRD